MRLARRSSTVTTIAVTLGLAACRSSAPNESVDIHEQARQALTGVAERVMSARSVEDEAAVAPLPQDCIHLSDENGPCEIQLRPGAEGLEKRVAIVETTVTLPR